LLLPVGWVSLLQNNGANMKPDQLMPGSINPQIL